MGEQSIIVHLLLLLQYFQFQFQPELFALLITLPCANTCPHCTDVTLSFSMSPLNATDVIDFTTIISFTSITYLISLAPSVSLVSLVSPIWLCSQASLNCVVSFTHELKFLLLLLLLRFYIAYTTYCGVFNCCKYVFGLVMLYHMYVTNFGRSGQLQAIEDLFRISGLICRDTS